MSNSTANLDINEMKAGYHNMDIIINDKYSKTSYPSLVFNMNYTFSYHPTISSVSLTPLDINETHYIVQIYGQGFPTNTEVILLDKKSEITYLDNNYIEASLYISEGKIADQPYYIGG